MAMTRIDMNIEMLSSLSELFNHYCACGLSPATEKQQASVNNLLTAEMANMENNRQASHLDTEMDVEQQAILLSFRNHAEAAKFAMQRAADPSYGQADFKAFAKSSEAAGMSIEKLRKAYAKEAKAGMNLVLDMAVYAHAQYEVEDVTVKTAADFEKPQNNIRAFEKSGEKSIETDGELFYEAVKITYDVTSRYCAMFPEPKYVSFLNDLEELAFQPKYLFLEETNKVISDEQAEMFTVLKTCADAVKLRFTEYHDPLYIATAAISSPAKVESIIETNGKEQVKRKSEIEEYLDSSIGEFIDIVKSFKEYNDVEPLRLYKSETEKPKAETGVKILAFKPKF